MYFESNIINCQTIMSKDQESSMSLSLRHTLQVHEERLMDFEKFICLLCKRQFKNGDQIRKHRSLSKLHSTRIKRLRQRVYTEDQLDRIERKEREILYRDRAKERRLKYGQTDKVIPIEPLYPGPSDKLTKSIPNRRDNSSAEPLGIDNKGAALMTKMGWREGSGLGKNDKGMTEIIKLESQVGTSGLGSKRFRVDPNLSYRDAVKQIMYQRYHELSSDEETT